MNHSMNFGSEIKTYIFSIQFKSKFHQGLYQSMVPQHYQKQENSTANLRFGWHREVF